MIPIAMISRAINIVLDIDTMCASARADHPPPSEPFLDINKKVEELSSCLDRDDISFFLRSDLQYLKAANCAYQFHCKYHHEKNLDHDYTLMKIWCERLNQTMFSYFNCYACYA